MQTIEKINLKYTQSFQGFCAIVPGEGDPSARLMLVGEAPGAQEALEGRPFVGKAGKNLNAFLSGVSLTREALYITNAVKFRPTKQGTGGRLSNRTPTAKEVGLFQPWLLEEIRVIRPNVIATLGNTALCAVTGERLTIGDVHGRPLQIRLDVDLDVVLFPLYHPASIIYRRELMQVYEEDIKALREYLL